MTMRQSLSIGSVSVLGLAVACGCGTGPRDFNESSSSASSSSSAGSTGAGGSGTGGAGSGGQGGGTGQDCTVDADCAWSACVAGTCADAVAIQGGQSGSRCALRDSGDMACWSSNWGG